MLLGLLAVLALIPATWAVRRVPEQAVRPHGAGAGARVRLAPLAPVFTWYVLFGGGYVAYMTFAIALLREQHLGNRVDAVFFVVLGLASAVGTLTVWSRVIARLRGGRAPALISAVVLIGVLPVLLWHGINVLLVR